MTGLIFLLVAIAMITALGGRRGIAGGLFGLSFVLSVAWLVHHMTDPLPLSFVFVTENILMNSASKAPISQASPCGRVTPR